LELAHEVAILIRIILKPKDDEVPDEDVVIFWGRDEIVDDLAIIVRNLRLEFFGKSFELLLETHHACFRHYYILVF
jgi:hypothetical protein